MTYTFTLTNTGDYIDQFSLSASGNWGCELPVENTDPLDPDEHVAIVLIVDVPLGVADQAVGMVQLLATSGLDSSVTDQAITSTTAAWLRTFISIVVR